jgi:hypothetical protein
MVCHHVSVPSPVVQVTVKVPVSPSAHGVLCDLSLDMEGSEPTSGPQWLGGQGCPLSGPRSLLGRGGDSVTMCESPAHWGDAPSHLAGVLCLSWVTGALLALGPR